MRIASSLAVAGILFGTAAGRLPAQQGSERIIVLPDLAAPLAIAGEHLKALGPRLAVATSRLQGLDGMLAELGLRLQALSWDDVAFPLQSVPQEWDPQDPADSLYRAARRALNRNEYWEAAQAFRQIRTRFPRSTYTPDALYWEAYATYRRGSPTAELRGAVALLDDQEKRFPQAATRGDAAALRTRILGELARSGDSDAERRIRETALEAVAPTPPVPPRPPTPPVAPAPPGARQDRGECRDRDDERSAALNALLQMDADRAVPILKQVLARRDAASACLRRKAVFILSQKEGSDTGDLLLDLARNDPDAEVRGQAVFWLSQVDGERAVTALQSILATSTDRDIQEKAIFALSQHDSEAAHQALRAYASRTDVPTELRDRAVFWIGQQDRPENAQFLRDLYGKTSSTSLKERILFSFSQMGNTESRTWLLGIARNPGESTEVRKKALFWLGQDDHTSTADLAGLYSSFTDIELKEQMIFVLSQRDGREAVDKLLEIAKTEPNLELKKKAIFWLSQSDDPRVAQFLADLLQKP